MTCLSIVLSRLKRILSGPTRMVGSIVWAFILTVNIAFVCVSYLPVIVLATSILFLAFILLAGIWTLMNFLGRSKICNLNLLHMQRNTYWYCTLALSISVNAVADIAQKGASPGQPRWKTQPPYL